MLTTMTPLPHGALTTAKLIRMLREECASRHEGPVPSLSELLAEAWVSAYLRVMWGIREEATPSTTPPYRRM